MARVFIHIGIHKTGSTALQRFLRKNHSTLIRHRYRYFHELYGCPEQEVIDTSIAEINSCTDDTTYIISNEALSGNAYSGYSDAGNELSKYTSIMANVFVLVFYREQVEFIESLYSQYIHEGRAESFSEFWAKYPREGGCYSFHLRKIEKALPHAKIIAMPYDKDTYLENALSALDITFTDKLIHLRERSNPSYNVDALAFAIKYNKVLSHEERKILRLLLQQVEPKNRDDQRTFLTRQWIDEQRRFYESDNNILFGDKRFTGGFGYRVFKNVQPYKRRSEEEIFLRILLSLASKANIGDSFSIRCVFKLENWVKQLLKKNKILYNTGLKIYRRVMVD